MKIIAQYFRSTFFVLFLIYSFLKMSPKDFDIFNASLGYGAVTILLSVNILAVYYDEKSTKSYILRTLSFIVSSVAIFAITIVFTSYQGFVFDDLPTWLKSSIRMPSSLAVLFSFLTLEKVWQKNQISTETAIHL